MHYASHASLKYLVGNRNKNNENHYPSDDAEIVADDMSITAQGTSKTCILC